MDGGSYLRLSKLLSLMLRHRPEEFGVEADRFGFAEVEEVLTAVQERLKWVTLEDVTELVEDSEKRRFEISGDKIRALYGHSFDIELDQDPVRPPEFLYQGVSAKYVQEIQREGITPRDRRYVHLSLSEEIASKMGREGERRVVLTILAQKAWESGVKFYNYGPVFLTESIPLEFVVPPEHGLESEITPIPQEADGPQYGRKKRRVSRRLL